ncbi:substrate-binding domain-containing protein [Streptomyces roseolus]|uniref:substrate-binding domain-containing protein n=1 Tax=Streptomyces roseolus TaxID=67358 RepID=UPI0037BDE46E
MAPGVRRALREVGIRAPGQVAVAGFDGTPEAETFPPPLTTARQDFAATGRRSIRLLVNHFEGRATERPNPPWSDSSSSSTRAPAPGRRLARRATPSGRRGQAFGRGGRVRPGVCPRAGAMCGGGHARRGHARRGHAPRAERVRPHVPGSDAGRAVRVELLRGAAAPSVPVGHPASRVAGGPEPRRLARACSSERSL